LKVGKDVLMLLSMCKEETKVSALHKERETVMKDWKRKMVEIDVDALGVGGLHVVLILW
jgi:hypothetical protein